MKSWGKTFGLGLATVIVVFLTARAQLTSVTQESQPPAPDSIVQLTADAYGLPRLTPDQATNSGYFCFWWVTPGGAALPMPIPPQDFSAMPVFLIAPGQFLVDATGGQVAVNPRLSRLQAAGRAVPSALESMANAVVNLVLTTRS